MAPGLRNVGRAYDRCLIRLNHDFESIQLKVRMPSGELKDMDRLPTRIDRNSEDFLRRKEINLQLIEELKQKIDEVRERWG